MIINVHSGRPVSLPIKGLGSFYPPSTGRRADFIGANPARIEFARAMTERIVP
jgi:hypothetical protein